MEDANRKSLGAPRVKLALSIRTHQATVYSDVKKSEPRLIQAVGSPLVILNCPREESKRLPCILPLTCGPEPARWEGKQKVGT